MKKYNFFCTLILMLFSGPFAVADENEARSDQGATPGTKEAQAIAPELTDQSKGANPEAQEEQLGNLVTKTEELRGLVATRPEMRDVYRGESNRIKVEADLLCNERAIIEKPERKNDCTRLNESLKLITREMMNLAKK